MTETCLFCHQTEQGHSQKVDYVCSQCVQKLLQFDSRQITALKLKAAKKDDQRQLKALAMFCKN